MTALILIRLIKINVHLISREVVERKETSTNDSYLPMMESNKSAAPKTKDVVEGLVLHCARVVHGERGEITINIKIDY